MNTPGSGSPRTRGARRATCYLGAVLRRLLFCTLLLAATARADEPASLRDLLYEAADAMDRAESLRIEGDRREADRLLSAADRYLQAARKLDPDDPAVAFARARLLRMDGDPTTAEAILLVALTRPQDAPQHLKGVRLLDGLRADQGRPPLRMAWDRARVLQVVGVAGLAAGVGVGVAGVGLAGGEVASATYQQRDVQTARRDTGWGVAAAGGGVAGAMGGLLIGATVQIDGLRAVLPGPWRFPGGPLERGARAGRRAKEARATRVGL